MTFLYFSLFFSPVFHLPQNLRGGATSPTENLRGGHALCFCHLWNSIQILRYILYTFKNNISKKNPLNMFSLPWKKKAFCPIKPTSFLTIFDQQTYNTSFLTHTKKDPFLHVSFIYYKSKYPTPVHKLLMHNIF